MFITYQVHRLDRDSSGILIMGRTQTSATILHSIFREKTFGASNNVSTYLFIFLQVNYFFSIAIQVYRKVTVDISVFFSL